MIGGGKFNIISSHSLNHLKYAIDQTGGKEKALQGFDVQILLNHLP